jgi:hypothetical protein
VIRWLAIVALLWPLSVSASSGAPAPATTGDDVVTTPPAAASPDAIDCLRAADSAHVHCHHATHGHLAVNAVSPEDRDDSAYVAYSEILPPLAAPALLTRLHPYPPPGDQPSFILFGNFRS